MSFILYAMGLVFALFVGYLAWQVCFWAAMTVLYLFIKHLRVMLGLTILPPLIFIGIVFTWPSWDPTPQGVYLRSLKTKIPSQTPTGFEKGSNTPDFDKVWQDWYSNRQVEVRRAELVKH